MRPADFTLVNRAGTLDYAFEVDFLVAQRRPHRQYPEIDDATTSSGKSKPQWLCPPNQANPTDAVVDECGAVVRARGQQVKLIRATDPDEIKKNWWTTPTVRSSWVVSPSPDAVPRPGESPDEYEWVGISLRSPLLSEHELKKPDSVATRVLTSLRQVLKMHVNSTCRFTVYLQPHGGVFALRQLKKVAVMAWLLEHDFLISLNGPRPHPDTLFRNSVLAWDGVPYASDEMKAEARRWIPRSCEPMLGAHLQDIWRCDDGRELQELLRGRDGSRLAFALDSYLHVGDDCTGRDSFMAALQYTTWHPYARLDDSSYFAKFAVHLGHFMDLEVREFAKLVAAYHGLARSDVMWADKQGRMQLLDVLGFDKSLADAWTDILEEMGVGGELGPACIDRQPPLARL